MTIQIAPRTLLLHLAAGLTALAAFAAEPSPDPWRGAPSSPDGGVSGTRPASPAGVLAATVPGAIRNATTGASFASLADAVADATAGDVLEVVALEHLEGLVTIDRSLTLRGATGAEVVKMSVDTGSSGDGRAWFLVGAGVDLTIEDLTFDGNGHLVHQGFRHRGTGRFARCTFRDLRFNEAGPDFAGTAIVAFGGNVEVRDSSFEGIGRVGVLVFGTGVDGAVIEGNTYLGKGAGEFLDYGVEVGGGARALVWNNSISECRGVVTADGSQSGAVLVTTFAGAGTSAIVDENTLVGNEVGLFAGFSAGSPDSSVVTASFNRIAGNTAAGLVSFSSSPVSAENNWWGCNGGPAAAGCDPLGGTGTIDASPFLGLNLDASPSTLVPSESAALTASLTRNSLGQETAGLGHLPDGTAVAFTGADLGTLTPATAPTLAGVAGATFTAGAAAGIDFVAASLDNATVSVAIEIEARPVLFIPGVLQTEAGGVVSVPVALDRQGVDVAAVAFSVDFDESCLAFDPTDGDGDGLPDALRIVLPPTFDVAVFLDLADTDGEIDVAISNPPPFAVIPDGNLIEIDLQAICVPPSGSLFAPVDFSTDPRPSFGDTAGQDVPGTASGNAVEVLGGLRGDCNGDGLVSAGDLSACGLEIFDGDGDVWLDVAGGSFAGNAVGCDANADLVVDAGDVACKERLIFGLACAAAPLASAAAAGPRLELPLRVEATAGTAIVPVSLDTAGTALQALVLSLDLDPDRAAFELTDADGDGLPDAIRVAAGAPRPSVRVDLADADGELDLLYSGLPRPLADGPLLEIELGVAADGPVDGALRFSSAPAASFGDALGRSVAGTAVLGGTAIFQDGFESGTLDAWTGQVGE